MNIYFIDANPYFPFCDAGAVVIAKSVKGAKKLVDTLGLKAPGLPEFLGKAGAKETKERIVYSNTGNY